MPALRTHALVIRYTDFSNSSRIFSLFTRDLGRVDAIAKGSRRLKSPFENGLDLLSVCDIVLLYKSNDTLDLLAEASLVERFAALRANLATMYAGCYLAELLTELTQPHDPHPRLFDSAIITLRNLNHSPLDRRRIMRFELALLQELGLMPSLDICVHCGLPPATEAPDNAVAFGLAIGGVLCADCRHGQPHVATLTGQTLALLRALASPGTIWRSLGTYREESMAREVVASVICHLLGRRPRMHRYLFPDIDM
jgi:DNA repair protein RecO (recombination protein O)